MTSPDELLAEAMAIPFEGWDFSRLGDRIILEPPPWSFEDAVTGAARDAPSMLDMGTGGGERLAALAGFPPLTCATESWAPNVPVAAARLGPRGIPVVRDEGADDNVEQRPGRVRGRLAFRDEAFAVVVSRHEAFVAREVCRVLRPGGIFVTQQASAGSLEFHALLGLDPPPVTDFTLELCVAQLESAGLRVDRAETGTATTVFADIGALAWYLANVPWAVPDFSIEAHRGALTGLHGAPVRVISERFLVVAHRALHRL